MVFRRKIPAPAGNQTWSSSPYLKRIKQVRNLEYYIMRNRSPGIIGLVKSRRQEWAGKVCRMGEIRNTHRISVGNTFWKMAICRTKKEMGR
jgi:hypothetical protein